MRIHCEQGIGYLLPFTNQHSGAVGDRILLEFAALLIEDLQFAVAGQDDHPTFARLDGVHIEELDRSPLFVLGVAALERAFRLTAGMKGAHGKLGARLANRLGGDDADRRSLLDKRFGRQVHAVTVLANAERRLAGHWAAD